MTVPIFILLLYLLVNIYVTWKINAADYALESRQKAHKRFIWIVPFLGPWMIRSFWKHEDSPLEIITKDDRKRRYTGFYESGEAF